MSLPQASLPIPQVCGANRTEPVCIEVLVRWGDHVLQVNHLRPARTFRLGERSHGSAACDVFVPREYVGNGAVPVVLQGPGAMLRAVLLAGAEARIELPTGHVFSKTAAIAQGLLEPCPEVPGAQQLWLHPGVRVCSRLARGSQGRECGPYRCRSAEEPDDSLVVVVGWVEAESRPKRRFSWWPDWMQGVSLAATVIAHAALFVWIGVAMPELAPTEAWAIDKDNLLLERLPMMAWNTDADEEPERSFERQSDGVPWEATPCGESGELGDAWLVPARLQYGILGPLDNPDPHIARSHGDRLWWESILGLTEEAYGASRHEHIAPWGRDDSLGIDAKSARGHLFGKTMGDARGFGGPGPKTPGTGASGKFGMAPGERAPSCELPDSTAGEDSGVHPGTPTVTGASAAQSIRKVVQAHAARFRHCADAALHANPSLRGEVMIQARIGEGGEIERVSGATSGLVSQDVVQCLVQTFGTLSFPEVTDGAVDVVYPMVISPRG